MRDLETHPFVRPGLDVGGQVAYLAPEHNRSEASTAIYVGIDVGYREHVAAACASSTFEERPDAWKRVDTCHFSSDAAGFKTLQRYLQRFSSDAANFTVLTELMASPYGLTLQSFLLVHGFRLLQVGTAAVKEYRERLLLSETKTDDVDARLLARMGYLHDRVGEEFAIRPVYVPQADARLMRELVRDRVALQREITRCRNQLQQVIEVNFPEYKTFFKKSTVGNAARALLERFPTPQVLAEAGAEEVASVLRKVRATTHAKRVAELQELGRSSVGVATAPSRWRQAWLLKQVRVLEEMRDELLTELEQLVHAHAYKPIIESLPVKGTVWTATLIAVIGDVRRFRTAAQFKAYLGWCPRVARSGTSVDKGGLATKGVRLSRCVLGQMTMLLITPQVRETPFRWIFSRLVARGMRPIKAMGHVAGRLSVVLYAMLKTMQPYDEKRHWRELGLSEGADQTM